MGKTWVPNRQRQTDHPCQGQVRSSAWPPHRRRRGGDSSPASGGTELRETPTVISFTPPPRQRVAAGAPLPLRSRRPRPLRGAASQSHAPPPAPPPRRSPRRPCLGGGVEPGHATAGVPRDLRRRPVSGSIGYTRGLTAAEVDLLALLPLRRATDPSTLYACFSPRDPSLHQPLVRVPLLLLIPLTPVLLRHSPPDCHDGVCEHLYRRCWHRRCPWVRYVALFGCDSR